MKRFFTKKWIMIYAAVGALVSIFVVLHVVRKMLDEKD